MKAEDILNERLKTLNNKKLTSKVGCYIQKFHIRMNALNGLDKQERGYFMHLHFNQTKKEILTNFNEEINTYLLNVIAGKFRQNVYIMIENAKANKK